MVRSNCNRLHGRQGGAIMFIDCIRCKKCGNITIKPEDEEFFSEWNECMCRVNEILEEYE